MTRLPIPPAHRVVQLPSGSLRLRCEWLQTYYSRHGEFSYRWLRRIALAVCAGQISQADAVRYLQKHCSPLELPHNLDLERRLRTWGTGRRMEVELQEAKEYRFRKDLTVNVHVNGLAWIDAQPHFLWLQLAKDPSLALQGDALRIWKALVQEVHAVAEYKSVPILILDFSAAYEGGSRMTKLVDLGEVQVASPDQVQRKLADFAEAYDALVAEGFEIPSKRKSHHDQLQLELI